MSEVFDQDRIDQLDAEDNQVVEEKPLPIHTSEDEAERSPTANKSYQSRPGKGQESSSVEVETNVSEESQLPLKRPKLAAPPSLVSYAIDEDEEDLMGQSNDNGSDTDESKHESDLSSLGKQVVGNVGEASPPTDSKEFPFLNLTEPATILISKRQLKEPIRVLSQDQLFAAQQASSHTPNPVDTAAPTTETNKDQSPKERIPMPEVQLPPEPAGHCPMELQEKVDREVRRMRLDISYDPNRAIQDNKAFRNPSIYEKLISFLNIDEKGTNFPPDIYNPYRWTPQSYYDELARVQNREIDRLMKLQKEQKKTEGAQAANGKPGQTGDSKMGAGSGSAVSSGSVATGYVEPKKRSKWDTGVPENPPTTVAPPAAILDSAQTTIPPVGSLVKQK
ncbi:unnamed protein product [Calicophoron daubneyi]|uniref:SAP30-binding protein n=1 Tax=Calicophoron daubneyi TaxID=300641 RepID=A0AAV2TCP3_CALDB